MTQERKVPSRGQQYLTSVAQRLERDKGAGAALKRSLTGFDEHRREVYPFLLPLLEGLSPRAQEPWFLVAALLALYPQPLSREKSISFGRSCWVLSTKTTSGGPERRLKSLLATDGADLAVPLAALVRLMMAQDVPIDYVALLTDLQRWDHPEQWVQDRWARDFWAGRPLTSDLVSSSTDR